MPRLYSWDPLPVSLTPDGRLAVAGNKDGELQLWDVHGGVCLKTLHVPGGGVRRVDISADGASPSRRAAAGPSSGSGTWPGSAACGPSRQMRGTVPPGYCRCG